MEAKEIKTLGFTEFRKASNYENKYYEISESDLNKYIESIQLALSQEKENTQNALKTLKGVDEELRQEKEKSRRLAEALEKSRNCHENAREITQEPGVFELSNSGYGYCDTALSDYRSSTEIKDKNNG